MDIQFIDKVPHSAVRSLLDEVLERGVNRLMVACAYCTGAGTQILSRHIGRFQQSGSCLVVSADHPTDIDAVNRFAKLAPGRVWIHQTGKLPWENGVGSALMHSKVFYAESGQNCWLWVGSHNLTGRALLGPNLEAGIVLSGHPNELPFVAARRHIEACRAESSPAPIEVPASPPAERGDFVVIHAECDRLPDGTKWHAPLGLQSADYDWLLEPPASVRLYLYRRGELRHGFQRASPQARYRGSLTGVNLTNLHPKHPGIPATWSAEHYGITERENVLVFSKPVPEIPGIVTQAAVNIDGYADPDEIFLSSRPKVEVSEQKESLLLGRADADIARFFSKSSIQEGRLVYEVVHRGDVGMRVALEELHPTDQLLFRESAGAKQVSLWDAADEGTGIVKHPLIHRAKYRLLRHRLM